MMLPGITPERVTYLPGAQRIGRRHRAPGSIKEERQACRGPVTSFLRRRSPPWVGGRGESKFIPRPNDFSRGAFYACRYAIPAGNTMIEARGLTKFYGARAAVSDLSFTVRPGIVTGFLGPNGAGKSTTMRLILGLDAPTAGDVRVNGRHYADHPAPLGEVGALLEARAIHTGRSARNHLLALAATHAIRASRVDQVLDLVGLSDVAGQRAGSFSLGMGQRLGLCRGAARGSRPGDPRGADQRPGPRGRALGPQPAQGAGRRRPDGVPVQSHDGR